MAGIYDAASATNPGLRKKLAPAGWHVATDAEWTKLTGCLGGESVAGGNMKSTGTTLWQSPNISATNESGFSGLPGGSRVSGGTFYGVGCDGYWWSSSEGSTTNAGFRALSYGNGSAVKDNINKGYGYSVRCLRD